MAYKHKLVQNLAQLVERYGSGGKDPMMRAVWFGIKGQVPIWLQALDENDEACRDIIVKILEALDIRAPEGYAWHITDMSIELEPEAKELVIEQAEETIVITPEDSSPPPAKAKRKAGLQKRKYQRSE